MGAVSARGFGPPGLVRARAQLPGQIRLIQRAQAVEEMMALGGESGVLKLAISGEM
ncbi:MAG: hypothetical protein OXN84_08685 [Albidovulum sp.]|nr:hypothetical protein [Albidovulum sp.]